MRLKDIFCKLLLIYVTLFLFINDKLHAESNTQKKFSIEYTKLVASFDGDRPFKDFKEELNKLIRIENIEITNDFKVTLSTLISMKNLDPGTLKLVPLVEHNLKQNGDLTKGTTISVYYACLAGETLASTVLILPGTEEVLLIASLWLLSKEKYMNRN